VHVDDLSKNWVKLYIVWYLEKKPFIGMDVILKRVLQKSNDSITLTWIARIRVWCSATRTTQSGIICYWLVSQSQFLQVEKVTDPQSLTKVFWRTGLECTYGKLKTSRHVKSERVYIISDAQNQQEHSVPMQQGASQGWVLLYARVRRRKAGLYCCTSPRREEGRLALLEGSSPLCRQRAPLHVYCAYEFSSPRTI
jgi:hypothetical protein